MTQTQDAPLDAEAEVTVTELVARTIAGVSQIGYARSTLEKAGHTVIISKNRLTIDKIVEAQLISASNSMWWNVYAADGTLPVFTVGAQNAEPINWMGCVE